MLFFFKNSLSKSSNISAVSNSSLLFYLLRLISPIDFNAKLKKRWGIPAGLKGGLMRVENSIGTQ